MSAGIKIYNPSTGGVIFNSTSLTTRIVGYVTDTSTSGTITVDNLGGGKIFWMLLDDDIDYQNLIGSSARNTKEAVNSIQFTINGNVLTYKKPSATKFVYGIYL